MLLILSWFYSTPVPRSPNCRQKLKMNRVECGDKNAPHKRHGYTFRQKSNQEIVQNLFSISLLWIYLWKEKRSSKKPWTLVPGHAGPHTANHQPVVFRHTSYLSFLGHRHTFKACTRGTKKCISSWQNGQNRPKFCVFYAKRGTRLKKKEHHRQ